MISKKVLSIASIAVLISFGSSKLAYSEENMDNGTSFPDVVVDENNTNTNKKNNKEADSKKSVEKEPISNKSYSLMEDKNDVWILAGVNATGETEYFLDPKAKDRYKNIYGYGLNYSGTFGGDIWKFMGLELTLAGRESNTEYSINGIKNKKDYVSFDLKAHFLFIPKVNINSIFAIRPYVGVGPTFHYVTMNHKVGEQPKKDYTSSLDVGGSFKFGVRFQVAKYFMAGVGLEYIIHHSSISDANGKKQDLSNLQGGIELGVAF